MEKANAEVELTSDVVSVSHLCKPNMWGIFGSNSLDVSLEGEITTTIYDCLGVLHRNILPYMVSVSLLFVGIA